MKNTILLFLSLATLSACNKNNARNVPIDSAMRSDFSYKPGTYWVYKDSASGQLDSAYVVKLTDVFRQHGGCVINKNAPSYEYMDITINVSTANPSDSEQWLFNMTENKFSIGFNSNRDRVEADMGFLLFTYPISTGTVAGGSGCVMSVDSGSVASITPSAT